MDFLKLKSITFDDIEFLYKDINKYKMDNIDRSLDKNKINEFLNNIMNNDIKEFYSIIIKNTRYISFNEIYNKLRNIIIELPYEKYNILFYNNMKIGSEHWLIILLWDLLKDKCIKIINDFEDINNNDPILILDDCIYSGCNMMGTIDNITYDYKNKYKISLTNLFLPIIPYANKKSCEFIEKDFKVKIYVGEYINDITDIKDLSKYISKGFNYLNETFKIESFQVMPIYFDHKIANEFGSFPRLYPYLIKNPISRDKINLLEYDIKCYLNHK